MSRIASSKFHQHIHSYYPKLPDLSCIPSGIRSDRYAVKAAYAWSGWNVIAADWHWNTSPEYEKVLHISLTIVSAGWWLEQSFRNENWLHATQTAAADLCMENIHLTPAHGSSHSPFYFVRHEQASNSMPEIDWIDGIAIDAKWNSFSIQSHRKWLQNK